MTKDLALNAGDLLFSLGWVVPLINLEKVKPFLPQLPKQRRIWVRERTAVKFATTFA